MPRDPKRDPSVSHHTPRSGPEAGSHLELWNYSVDDAGEGREVVGSRLVFGMILLGGAARGCVEA